MTKFRIAAGLLTVSACAALVCCGPVSGDNPGQRERAKEEIMATENIGPCECCGNCCLPCYELVVDTPVTVGGCSFCDDRGGTYKLTRYKEDSTACYYEGTDVLGNGIDMNIYKDGTAILTITYATTCDDPPGFSPGEYEATHDGDCSVMTFSLTNNPETYDPGCILPDTLVVTAGCDDSGSGSGSGD